MNILVAMDCSGILRDAFRARGHKAVSCDLKPTQRPGPHLQCDVREVLHHPWDMMVAMPVCRYSANSGVRWLRSKSGRWDLMIDGARMFRMLDGGAEVQHIPRRCVENSIMHAYAAEIVGRRADQFVHPWWFGSPFQKATGLHLTGLPALPREYTRTWYAGRGIHIVQKVWRMAPGPDREEKRSETDPQIARAMAQYWG